MRYHIIREMRTTEMLEKSIIVAAHPDDEILWFSSIIDKVDEVVLCFLYRNYNPKWKNPNITFGREKSLSEIPLSNLTCLGLNESEVFSDAHWQNPILSEYGMRISGNNLTKEQYKKNYYILKERLTEKLKGYRNVFTHNPWGEYGNEEHVQVHRVIKDLQRNMNFDLWCSNYCSNKSINLALRYVSGYGSEYVTLKTNPRFASNIKALYMKNKCWSWYDDWEWLNEESFMNDETSKERNNTHGHIFPLNMIKVEFSKKSNIIFRIFRMLSVRTAKIKSGSN